MAIDHFNNVSDKVWKLLEATKYFRMSFRETSITDLILLWLFQNQTAFKNFQDVRIFKISQSEEKSCGADWEWWIDDYRYAIQAKKLSHKTHITKSDSTRYDSLASPTNQIQVLADYAPKEYSPMPLYAFYNYVPKKSKAEYDSYWHCCCFKDSDKEKFGITVTPLKNVEWAINTPCMRSFEAIHELHETIPARCLFCRNSKAMNSKCSLQVYLDEKYQHPDALDILYKVENFAKEVENSTEKIPELSREQLPPKLYKRDSIYLPKYILKSTTDKS